MRKMMIALVGASALGLAAPAHAGDANGQLQVKLLGTGVLPDGRITDVRTNVLGLPATTQTAVDDNIVPTVAIEYFVTPNFSIETICCITSHDVEGRGAIDGASVIDNATALPATVTAKYHFGQPGGIQPYIGAGPAYFFYFGEDAGATVQSLGVTRASLSDEFGVAVQAGVNVPLNARGLGLSIDAKRYFIDTTARFFNAGGAEVLRTRHELDPWVISAGISYRF